jgi:hypothetical protein
VRTWVSFVTSFWVSPLFLSAAWLAAASVAERSSATTAFSNFFGSVPAFRWAESPTPTASVVIAEISF